MFFEKMPFQDLRAKEHFLERVVGNWSIEKPDAAREWVEANAELTAEGKTKMLATIGDNEKGL